MYVCYLITCIYIANQKYKFYNDHMSCDDVYVYTCRN